MTTLANYCEVILEWMKNWIVILEFIKLSEPFMNWIFRLIIRRWIPWLPI